MDGLGHDGDYDRVGEDPRMSERGKRVSWVELYLDLVFVLAIGQLAHLIVDRPSTHSVWVALGLFVTLWWTWVGFAVLYNRRGAGHSRRAAPVPGRQRARRGGRGRDRAGVGRGRRGLRAEPRRRPALVNVVHVHR